MGGHQTVHQGSQQQRQSRGNQPLPYQQHAPCQGPPSRRPPNQDQGATARGQLANELFDLAEQHGW